MLCVEAAYRNVYCVTWHRHTLHSLGMPYDQIDQLLLDHHGAALSPPDKALLDFALELATRGRQSGVDVGALRQLGFKKESVLIAILVTALAHLLYTLSATRSSVERLDHTWHARNVVQRTSLPYCSNAFTLSRIFSELRRFGWI